MKKNKQLKIFPDFNKDDFAALGVNTKDIKRIRDFYNSLYSSAEESEVVIAYIRFFNLKVDMKQRHDLYTPQMLYEFKWDRNFKSRQARAQVLAQLIYYVHGMRFNPTEKEIPKYLCLADRNEVIITETELWIKYFEQEQGRYDWSFAASNPDIQLVKDLENDDQIATMPFFNLFIPSELLKVEQLFKTIYTDNPAIPFTIKKMITERNFEVVYNEWYDKFGEDVRNGRKPSEYFLCDIQRGRSMVNPQTLRVMFNIAHDQWIEKKLNQNQYNRFWKIFDRTSDKDLISGILSKIDRLSDDYIRRFEGEYYTPIPYTTIAHDYIAETLGDKNWWKTGKYRLWDMAAGTGNLEYYLPAEAYKYMYLSTLHDGDVRFLKRTFKGALCFQYDYLNDDIDSLFNEVFLNATKMPKQLENDLKNPDITWIILINPPFATSQDKSNASSGKAGVSDTAIRKKMHLKEFNLGETSRELFAQFLFRIHHEFKHKKAYLCLFSKLKYINANNDQRLRDNIFKYKFERGFMFDSRAFYKVKPFPVGFIVWNLSVQEEIKEQNIILDVWDRSKPPVKVAQKTIKSNDRSAFLNNWVDRPAATIVFPPFSSGLNVNANKKDIRDRIAKGFICSMCSPGNDVQHIKYTALLSGPYGSAGAWSVIPDNFERSMVIFAVKKTTTQYWYNDRDQFMQPNCDFPQDFVNDCVVYSLFHSANQTVSLQHVKYKGKEYNIPNHLFPFLITEVKKWKCSDPDITSGISADSDRFAALWLQNKTLTQEAQHVVDAAREMYKKFFEKSALLNTNKFRVAAWDAGLYQIKACLSDEEYNLDNDYSSFTTALKSAMKALETKIDEEKKLYGFLG
ncbi:MAG: hypothetical protein SPL96_00750 [Bacteroidales bacterium]|nr:hypothetical protein [Bacteroidales bacterium]